MLLRCLWLVLVPLTYAISGDFSVLSFNVAGLPRCINKNGVPGSKSVNAKLIGRQMEAGRYTVIHVQEDFNYHSALYSTAQLPYRTRTSGGVPFGSGLNTLSQRKWTMFKRVTWKNCFINEGDCLTRKGFTFMRMRMADGVDIDFYNLHADAGSMKGDVRARKGNFAQLRRYIDRHSAGRAVIIAGDTNQRYTNTPDLLTILTDGSGLTDAWVKLVRGGRRPLSGAALGCANPSETEDCEVVDKVLYRGGRDVRLVARKFEYASKEFLQEGGKPLSDHNPIAVHFQWELR